MSKTLVIVESPGKVKKIQSILGSKYLVTASVGHIIDLPREKMSVDITNNFEPTYKPCSAKAKKVIKQLKDMHEKCSDVLLATDEDREGEMIAWSVAYVLKLKKAKRIVFNSITKDEILKAVKSPKTIDYNLVNAAKARRILDRVVGYELSPILWKNIKYGLSAGRVQSVVARLIVDKEREIEAFFEKGADSYFKFKGEFLGKDKTKIESVLYNKTSTTKNGIFKGNCSKISNEKDSKVFMNNAIKSVFKVENVTTKPSLRNPSAPFTTSTLQQEASRKLGYSVSSTMRAAQVLYEAGLITYMRTDSINLSNEAIKNIGDYVLKTYGKNYYNKKIYKAKNNNTQEAHEAVRPTDVFTTSAEGKGPKIGNSEIKLYQLIWKRTVASQMKSAKFDVTTIQISISKEKKRYFQSSLEKLVFPGFLKVYNLQNLEDDDEEGEGNITNVPSVGDKLKATKIVGTQEYTKPPTRYNEASLINKLDPKNLNIGRPATYASMITVIQKRGYVEKSNVEGESKQSLSLTWDGGDKIKEKKSKVMIGKDKNKFVPTTLGKIVNDFLAKEFSVIMDYQFTSNMEGELDDIAIGKKLWHNVLDNCYTKFHPNIEKLEKSNLVVDKYTRKLGVDPETGYEVIATMGKHSEMVKLCGPTKAKSNSAPIKSPLELETITLAQALKLMEYPKQLGKFERKVVHLHTGKFGLFLKWGGKNYSILDKDGNRIEGGKEVALDEAINSIKLNLEKQKGLGQFSSDTKIYTVLDGKFGKYIQIIDKKKPKAKAKNVSLPKDTDVKKLTLEKVEKIIEDHYKKPRSKKSAPKKKTAKAKK